MTVISKELFYERIGDSVKCNVVHHWERNCIKSAISPYMIFNVAKGAARFFLPIYLLKLLINYKKMNDVDFLKEILMSEFNSTLYGLGMASGIISSICVLRKVFGRIHYYNVLFFPGALSGLSLLIESKENQILDTLIFFNSLVEATLNNLHFFEILRFTKYRETFMFMTVSAMLMYALENRTKNMDYMHFWFYTPSKKKHDRIDKNICSHTDNCYNFLYKGFFKYFTLGYIVNIIRSLLPKMGVLIKKPFEMIRILFNKANVKFGLFIGSYVALYRILTCYFIKTGIIRNKFHGLIAGFLSGLTYMISPNIQVLVIGITTLLQIMYDTISSKLNITNHFWPRIILFMFCHGTLLHNKFFYPQTCPTYYKNMIDACTSNMTSKMYDNIITKFFL